MHLLTLEYPGHARSQEIRSIYRGDEVLFSLEDVLRILARENTRLAEKYGPQNLVGLVRDTIEALDPDEFEWQTVSTGQDTGRQEPFVSEPGLYRVISRDTTPAAKNFQRWVFHEVLPSIQKYGTYPPPVDSGSSDLKALAKQLVDNTNLLLQEIAERERLEKETVERFESNESVIRRLSDRLAEVQDPPANDLPSGEPYRSVEAFAQDQGLEDEQVQLLWGYAAQYCIETRIRSKKPADPRAWRRHEFPESVLNMAYSKLETQPRR